MFLRIQTAEGDGAETASDVLKRGFVDLKKMCAITRKKFNKEREEFQVCLHSSAYQFRDKLCMYNLAESEPKQRSRGHSRSNSHLSKEAMNSPDHGKLICKEKVVK